jgi:hypothetical protein
MGSGPAGAPLTPTAAVANAGASCETVQLTVNPWMPTALATVSPLKPELIGSKVSWYRPGARFCRAYCPRMSVADSLTTLPETSLAAIFTPVTGLPWTVPTMPTTKVVADWPMTHPGIIEKVSMTASMQENIFFMSNLKSDKYSMLGEIPPGSELEYKESVLLSDLQNIDPCIPAFIFVENDGVNTNMADFSVSLCPTMTRILNRLF